MTNGVPAATEASAAKSPDVTSPSETTYVAAAKTAATEAPATTASASASAPAMATESQRIGRCRGEPDESARCKCNRDSTCHDVVPFPLPMCVSTTRIRRPNYISPRVN